MKQAGIEIRTKKAFSIQPWSGGTTTELYIHPVKGSYAQRIFDFRLSMATIEVEHSEFTPLPGISRKTLILEGEIQLQHEGQEAFFVRKHDVAQYDGGWETSSVGKCTDFNLMTQGSTKGDLEGRILENGEQVVLPRSEHAFVYVHTGRIAVISGAHADMVEEGSLLKADTSSALIILKALEPSEIVLVQVQS